MALSALLLGVPVQAAPSRLIIGTTQPERAAAYLGATVRPIVPDAPRPGPAALAARRRWFLLSLPEDADAPMAARALVAQGLAKTAELDRAVRTQATPSDPYFSSQGSWGQLYDDQWGLKVLHMEAAWNIVRGDPSVVVAVVDTGTDFLHPDLQKSLWINTGEVPGNGLDDDGNGYVDDVYGYDFASGLGGRDSDPTDGYGHGTLVGGIAGADTDNGIGVAGITWGCRLMVLKALDDTGSGYVSDVGAAMLYAIDEGAKVINLSLSASGRSPFLESMVAAARQAGVTVTASAGNFGIDVEELTPANIDDAVTVGARGIGGGIPAWSNYGATIDVTAPGVDILGPRALATDFMQSGTSVVGTDYFRASGTSFAAPAVSGLAALLYAAEPGIDRDRVVNALRAGAVDVGAAGNDERSGWGSIDAPRMISRLRDLTARIDTPAFRQVHSFGATLAVSGTASGGDFASWQLLIGTGKFPSSFTALTPVRTTPLTGGSMYSGPSVFFVDGLYTLRLLVVSTDGIAYEDRRLIEIDNSRGRIQGSVRWQVDGSPATGVNVWAMDPVTQSFVEPADMGAGGTFQFTEGLPAGFYVLFADGSYSEFDSEYWQDTLSFPNATRIQVTPNGTVTGIDFMLARRPRVRGNVYDQGGSPLAGHVVELLYAATQGVAAATGTGADGSWELRRLPNGDFYVRARAGDATSKPEYWQEAPAVSQATVVTLGPDQVLAGIDFTLAPNSAAIEGIVTRLFGPPIASFPVEALPTKGGFFRSVTTDAQGRFRFDRLPAGGYSIRTGSDLDWELQYYDRSPDAAGARIIHVLDGATFTGADLVLRTTWFDDVTAQVGPLLQPESFDTQGVVPAILDDDDLPDLYLVNQLGPNSYLLQDPTGTFRDEARERGAGAADLKAQAVVFDMDNDGDRDIYVPKYGRFGAPSLNLLLRNDGPRFSDATFDGNVVSAKIGMDAAVGDYDADGYLDLYLVNNFEVNALYRNDGDGTFTDVTAASGAGGAANNNTQCATFADVDGDRDLDLFVTASEFPSAGRGNLLFINQGGVFSEEGQARGVMLPPGAYGGAFGDVDADGDLDLFVTSSYGGTLYLNDGAGRFTDATAAWGLTGVDESSGCSFGDLDADGVLDLVIADYVGGVGLYMGTGSGFVNRSHLSGVVRTGQSRHLALVDLDRDGRLDIVLSHDYTGNRVYRNRLPAKRYLEVRLHGRLSNRDGVGAVVRLSAMGRTQMRLCGAGDAGNKVYPVMHFGLDAATSSDLLIEWPSGVVQTLTAVPSDQVLHVWEPLGAAILASPGPSSANPAVVRTFDALGLPLAYGAWKAYGGASFGAHPAGGELDASIGPSEDVATMPGEGPTLAPHVRGFEEGGVPIPGMSFFAYGALRYGGRIALGEGYAPLVRRILTGPGPGASLASHVRGFQNSGAALPGLSFYAYTGLGYGVRPAATDLDGDGRDEILTAPGGPAGAWSNIRAFRYTGSSVALVPGGSFYAFTGPTAGASVAGGGGTVIAAPGPSPSGAAQVRGFAYQTGAFVPLPGYDATVLPGLMFGVSVAAADLDGTGYDEALAAAGPGPTHQAHVRALGYDGSTASLLARPNFLAYGPAYRYGADVGSVVLRP